MVAHTRSWWVEQTQPTYKIASGIGILDVDNWIIRLGNAAQCQFPGICSPHFALSTTGLIYGGGAHSHDAVGEMVCDYLRAIHNGVGEVTLCKNSVANGVGRVTAHGQDYYPPAARAPVPALLI